ncbi:glutaredoxin family protein [Chitinibacter bivalviorum]|uniref:Glutaredoxin family protein n=1 Tax=Chitinibacter bivalviorum TaxID=2739434 RepID=A0A7H9BGW7_9NEIS|nr:glutaredoxin family protein [Chitinibacter bivalviorum]QLG87963.1 glutaredoxin family protein [Chitinibacter bivalviorum]
MKKLKLYGREYCSLCVVMREQLLSQAAGRFDLQWIDIDDVEPLEERYGEWVPVLTDSNDVEICHYHLDQLALDARLADLG